MDCGDLEGFSSVVCDHAARPRNRGALQGCSGHARVTGPCGDTMEFWVAVKDGKVAQISFITDGCGPSLACGSMATCLAEGKSVEEAAALEQSQILEALGGLPPEFEHCALLAANTLKAACEDHRERLRASTGRTPAGSSACDACGDATCSSMKRRDEESEQQFRERMKLQSRLSRIRKKVVVLSGKGGVGKSTVAVHLAALLSAEGKRVGLLDVDIHGPSIPTMLGLEGETIHGCDDGLVPVDLGGMKVMSLGFLLQNPDDAVIWRGPMKMGVIQQFLRDVVWGDLDCLIIDCPPGTGDEPLSVCQLAGRLDGAVVVTTPQKVAAVDVRKSITFCRQLEVPVLGVVENMSGFVCPKCGEVTRILGSGAGRRIAEDMGVAFLGSIPMDARIAEACDNGRAHVQQQAGMAAAQILRSIVRDLSGPDGNDLAGTPVASTGAAGAKESTETKEIKETKEDKNMIIAIPLAGGKLSLHFGHCESFALVEVDPEEKKILGREDVDSPPHQPGLLPPWLAQRGAGVIIAGGMGQRAQSLFAQHGIQVVVGAPAETPEKLVTQYLAGNLQVGDNICDH